ncbi:MAG: transcriptional regulator [Pedobacter sp.]|nr:MAG: transcriptional regulator [Pedobacter sp.]
MTPAKLSGVELEKMSLKEHLFKVDLTLANLSILKTEKAKALRFSMVEVLRKVLEFQQGDLLDFEPGGELHKILFCSFHFFQL